MNGTRTITQTFNAANQADGLTYDAAGNLINDGSATYAYDALNRLTIRSTTPYTYNGDGALVDDGTTRYTQDLASPLSQVLQTTQGSTTTNYLYGLDRLAAVAGSTRTWYGYDALGSVRQTFSNTGAPLGVVNYDPWGTPESGSVPTFGFTGEMQSGGMVNLRARWYSTGQGRFTSRDAFAGFPDQPYSLHPYQYGYSNPVLLSDPSGRAAKADDGDGTADALCRAIGWMPYVILETGEHHCIPKPPPPAEDLKAARFPPRLRSNDVDPENGQRVPRADDGFSPFAPGPDQGYGGGVIGPSGQDLGDYGIGSGDGQGGQGSGLGKSIALCLLFLTTAGFGGFSLPPAAPGNHPPSGGRRGKHYVQADGFTIKEGFDPLNAQNAVKLGYDENLYRQVPDGYSIHTGWFWAGLASQEDQQNGWWVELLDALEHTNTINFVVDDMDVFNNPTRLKAIKYTHDEMDAVINRGYIGKLHLWKNGQELTGPSRVQWINAWKQLCGLP